MTDKTEERDQAVQQETVLDFQWQPMNVKTARTSDLIDARALHSSMIQSFLRLLSGAAASGEGMDQLRPDDLYDVVAEIEVKLGYVDAVTDEIEARLKKAEGLAA